MPSFHRAVLPRTPMSAEGMDRRADERLADALLDELLADSRTRFLVFTGETRLPGHVVSLPGADASSLRCALLDRAHAERFLEGARAVVALGTMRTRGGRDRDDDAGAGVVAVLAARGPVELAPNEEPVSVRTEMMHASATGDVPYLSALGQGQAITAWHATHEFSPESGMRTVVHASGWIRECPEEGTEFFPRTDPAVIVALVDQEDRIILGHNAAWPATRYSTFAGFVEPAETAEQAVVRELAEEAGVVIDEVRYLGSQPWPFPRSLMLGFIARTRSVPLADGVEITKARAFTREELAAAVAAGEVELPAELSISRSLIEAWIAAGRAPATDGTPADAQFATGAQEAS